MCSPTYVISFGLNIIEEELESKIKKGGSNSNYTDTILVFWFESLSVINGKAYLIVSPRLTS